MMKRIGKADLLKFSVIALACAMFCGVPAASLPAKTPSYAALVSDYDYSDPNYAFFETADEADIVAAYAGGITDAEAEYLSAHGEIALKYRDAIDISSIVTDFSEEEDRLTVTPAP